ncbi:TPA: hypothetical protein IAA68_08790 [Candidatus Galligastranaerophilus faecipullorum]|nr:hypothetical protein [Candidatus Galligastranaerophilus faecipullorum]
MTPVNASLMALLIVTAVVILILGILLARLIINLTLLSKNVDSIAQSVQSEIQPTLKELREAAQSINSIANNADTQFSGIQSALKSVLGASSLVGCKMKGLMDGLVKGISFGLNLFNKK